MRFVFLLAVLLIFVTTVSAAAKKGTTVSPIPLRTIPLPPPHDGKLVYEQVGTPQGQRVIFLHGTPGSKGAWSAYMEDVPPGRIYLAVDRPGFGDSGPKKVVSIWEQAKILAPLLAPSPPILVGHSYGATLAAVMAALYPDKVAGIVIVAGSVSPHLDKQKPLFRMFKSPALRWMVPRGLNKANDEVLALEEESLAFPILWRNIRCPVVVLQGSEDSLVSVENVIYMEKMMINAQLDITVLEGADHFLIWDKKAEVDDAIKKAVAYACPHEYC